MPSEKANKFMKRLADVMQEKRKAKGISQEVWSASSGIDRATVSRWERADRIPSIMALYDLAAALGYRLHELCEEAEEDVKRG